MIKYAYFVNFTFSRFVKYNDPFQTLFRKNNIFGKISSNVEKQKRTRFFDFGFFEEIRKCECSKNRTFHSNFN